MTKPIQKEKRILFLSQCVYAFYLDNDYFTFTIRFLCCPLHSLVPSFFCASALALPLYMRVFSTCSLVVLILPIYQNLTQVFTVFINSSLNIPTYMTPYLFPNLSKNSDHQSNIFLGPKSSALKSSHVTLMTLKLFYLGTTSLFLCHSIMCVCVCALSKCTLTSPIAH